MFQYLIRRLLWAGVLFIGVTLITYVLFFQLPADPARLAAGKSATADDVERVAHQLGLDVVAEGVENAAIWNALTMLGCDVAQGYGIARPMAFPDLRGWLSRWNDVRVDDLVIAK